MLMQKKTVGVKLLETQYLHYANVHGQTNVFCANDPRFAALAGKIPNYRSHTFSSLISENVF